MKPNKSCINFRPSSSLSPSPITAVKVDKNRRKSHEDRLRKSTNSVSSSMRPPSPSTELKQLLSKQQNPVSGSQPSSLCASVVNKDATTIANNSASLDSKPTKRKSFNDVATLQGNSTHSSIKHDLSKKNQTDCSSNKPVVSNSSAMPKISNMSASTNGLCETSAASSSAASSMAETTSTATAVTSTTQDQHLQAPASLSVNLSSNSSLNSSSVKFNSKTNEVVFTEKKRKPMSSSRQKKFHRRFKQVAMDEEVINYFSCAYVSDILLQGYMYITKNYIAFYSNVFGYITKFLIPIEKVTKISKEKTVKIIPNAIAVATLDERHVFSSFLSREAAYQLMLSIWKEALPLCDIDVSSSSALLRICTANADKNFTNSSDAMSESKLSDNSSVLEKLAASTACTLQVVQQHRKHSNSGVSELDDESSSAISGSEGLTKLLQKQLLSGDSALNNQLMANSSSSSNSNSNSHQSACDLAIGQQCDASNRITQANSLTSTPKITGSASKLQSAFGDNSSITFLNIRIPRTIHIAYFGLSLVIILALMAGFLFYRISEMKNARMTRTFSADDLNTETPNINLYAEVLKWQKDMQAQRVHLTRNVLANNLEQISQISDSLQTLSSLIHSNEESRHVNDRISSIMGECNSLEACILDQKPNP